MNEFARLKPLCDALANRPTKAAVLDLQEALVHVDKKTLQHLQGYVLLPLITQVDTNNERNKLELLTALIDTITSLLQRTRLKKSIPLQVITAVLLRHTFDTERYMMWPNLSEEFKLSVLRCIDQLFQSLDPDLIPEVYFIKNSGLFGHIVYMVLSLIRNEKYRKIRIAGLKCLMSVFFVHESADLSDVVSRDHVSNHVFLMLPKVVVTLHRLALSDLNEGIDLITLSINALGKILCLVFEDYSKDCVVDRLDSDDFRELFAKSHTIVESDLNNSDVLGLSNCKTVEEKTKQMNELKRTDEWQKAAIQKLHYTLEQVSKQLGSTDQRVRWAIARMACEIIETCSSKIQSHLNSMLQVLVALTQDEDSAVSKLCFSTLTNITTCANAAQHLDQLERIFHALLIRLPRIIFAGSDTEQMAEMLLLNGLLQSLSQTRLKSVLSCAETLDRFLAVILSLFELERSMDLLHEQSYAGSVQLDPSLGTPWKRYVNMRNATLVKHAEQMCRIVGRSNAVELIFKCLMDRLVQNHPSCNEVLVVLQFLLALNGWGEVVRIEQCLHEVLEKRHWELDVRADRSTQIEMDEFGESNWYEDRTEGLYESAISVRYTDVRWRGPNEDQMEKADNSLTINDAKFNVLHMCLVLETVGRLGQDLRHAFQPFMLKSLHRVLEKTGSNNLMIHTAGAYALDCLTNGMGYKDVAKLISDNSDYISHFVNLTLKKNNQSKNALDILSVVLRYSSIHSVPYLEGIINTVLNESAKPSQMANISSFLKVFHMLLTGFNRWTLSANSSVCPPKSKSPVKAEILQQWLELIKPPKPDLPVDNIDDTEEPQIDQDDPTETSPAELPTHIKIACTILKRCIKYISIKSKMDKCLVLDAIAIGLNLIRDHENELLPMVHALWPSFAERVRDQDAVILRKCFGVLVVLSTLAKDFLYKRTATDIFPFILSFLKQAAVKSQQRLHDASFENTQQCHLTLELFGQLPQLIQHLEMPEKDLDQLLDHVRPFLNADHHRIALQQGAREFMIGTAQFHACAVYIKLLDIQHERAYQKCVEYVLNKMM